MNTIKRKTANTKSRQVGRGGRRGKTSGRGTKGQNARAGRKKRPEIRDRIKKIPKLRGYKFSSIKTKPIIVKISEIEKSFSSGEKVTPMNLAKKGIIKKVSGHLPQVKILNGDKLTKKIIVSNCLVSESAKKKILDSGGTIE